MPATSRQTICRAVSTRYIVQRRLAVSLIVGLTPSVSGPGASKRNIRFAVTPVFGSSATSSTRIPRPPSHWESDLQNSSVEGSASMSRSTVAPVVLRPLMDSK